MMTQTTTREVQFVFDTPKGMELYRLAAIKGRLKLESEGMKARGASTRSVVAAELGLRPRDPYPKFLEAIQTRVEQARAEVYKDQLEVSELGDGVVLVKSLDRTATINCDRHCLRHIVKFYEDKDKTKEAKGSVTFDDETLALDAAEEWVLGQR